MSNATAQDPIKLLRGLRAVRHFRPDPVPEAVIDDVLDVARWSGSASNVQPWEFMVIRDRATLQKLAALEGTPAHLGTAPLGIVLIMDGDPEREAMETYDEGRLAERIMLTAAAHGVGTCIAWFRGAGLAGAKEVLGIPPERLVRTAISVGYPDEEARRQRNRPAQPRKPMAELVSHDRYGQRTPG